MSGEADLYPALMVEATRLGHRLFRNNTGRAKYRSATGDVYTVPYGVGNRGGADLIGWVHQEFRLDGLHTERLAVFCAVEVKQKGKKATKEQAQFLEAVRAAGGIAGVVEDIASYHKLIGHVP